MTKKIVKLHFVSIIIAIMVILDTVTDVFYVSGEITYLPFLNILILVGVIYLVNHLAKYGISQRKKG